MTHQLDQQPATRAAYRGVLQFIHRSGLGLGDRLPARPELCRAVGCCNVTLHRAMTELARDGVLVGQRRTGTVITALAPPAQARFWQVGVVVNRPEAGPFAATVAAVLRHHLAELGATDHTFILGSITRPAEERRCLDDFPGLGQAVAAGRLDAAISVTRLATEALPLCTIGEWRHARHGVLISHGGWMAEAGAALAGRGATRPALVAGAASPASGFDGPQREFRRLHGADAPWIDSAAFDARRPQATAGAVAEAVLVARAAGACDALVIPNDMLASHLLPHLARRGWRAPAAVVTNSACPLPLPEEACTWEIDTDQLCRQAVELVISHLLTAAPMPEPQAVEGRQMAEVAP